MQHNEPYILLENEQVNRIEEYTLQTQRKHFGDLETSKICNLIHISLADICKGCQILVKLLHAQIFA